MIFHNRLIFIFKTIIHSNERALFSTICGARGALVQFQLHSNDLNTLAASAAKEADKKALFFLIMEASWLVGGRGDRYVVS